MEPACYSSRCASISKSATKATTRKGIAEAIPFLLNNPHQGYLTAKFDFQVKLKFV
jgi:hypothetical protein